jgi:hypothetical protein
LTFVVPEFVMLSDAVEDCVLFTVPVEELTKFRALSQATSLAAFTLNVPKFVTTGIGAAEVPKMVPEFQFDVPDRSIGLRMEAPPAGKAITNPLLAIIFPVPESVPPVRETSPDAVMSPDPFNTPVVKLNGPTLIGPFTVFPNPLNVADARLYDPPASKLVVPPVLLIEEGGEMVAPDRKVTVPPRMIAELLSIDPERNSTDPSVRRVPCPCIELPLRSLLADLSLRFAPVAIEKSPA